MRFFIIWKRINSSCLVVDKAKELNLIKHRVRTAAILVISILTLETMISLKCHAAKVEWNNQ